MRDLQQFQEIVWDYYAKHARDLPWRSSEADGSFDPYKIMVSEIMLQQTQVSRVIPKYEQFLTRFPNVSALADAQLGEVISVWQGLGYNRRAKYLQLAAKQVVREFGGMLPASVEKLEALPGIGKNTAAAICAYAFNQSVSFIETNIRSVYIHHFFNDTEQVHDKDILKFVEQTCDQEMPREWYWALMDYGSYLKSSIGNMSRQSKAYVKQSKFEGSRRQIRGNVLRYLSEGPHTEKDLQERITDERLGLVINDLEKEFSLIFPVSSDFSYEPLISV